MNQLNGNGMPKDIKNLKKILRNDIVKRICDKFTPNPELSKTDNFNLIKNITMEFLQICNQELINENILDLAQLGKFEIKEHKGFNTKFVKFTPATSLAKGLRGVSTPNQEAINRQRDIIKKNLQNYDAKQSSTTNRKLVDNADNIFNIDNFPILFSKLKEEPIITSGKISNKLLLEPKANSTGNIPKKYYKYDSDIRSYIYGDFLYNGVKIGFIEIEANNTWRDISTWFFIFHDLEEIFNENRVNDIIFQYLGSNKKMKEMEDFLLKRHNITFFRKVHPDTKRKELSEKDISNWCKLLLKNLAIKI